MIRSRGAAEGGVLKSRPQPTGFCAWSQLVLLRRASRLPEEFPPLAKGGPGGVTGLDRLQNWQEGTARRPSPQSLRATPPGPPLIKGGR